MNLLQPQEIVLFDVNRELVGLGFWSNRITAHAIHHAGKYLNKFNDQCYVLMKTSVLTKLLSGKYSPTRSNSQDLIFYNWTGETDKRKLPVHRWFLTYHELGWCLMLLKLLVPLAPYGDLTLCQMTLTLMSIGLLRTYDEEKYGSFPSARLCFSDGDDPRESIVASYPVEKHVSVPEEFPAPIDKRADFDELLASQLTYNPSSMFFEFGEFPPLVDYNARDGMTRLDMKASPAKWVATALSVNRGMRASHGSSLVSSSKYYFGVHADTRMGVYFNPLSLL